MTDLWEDLDGLSRKPGPTMTITKGQFGALLNEIATLRAALDGLVAAGMAFVDVWGETEAMESSHAFVALRAALATAKEAGK
jgi:hypothetical protein